MNITTTSSKVSTKDLLIVGFDNNFTSNFIDSTDLDYYNCHEYDDSSKAFKWLTKRVEFRKTPLVGIICSLKFLKSNSYSFAKQLQNHAQLRNIPLIAIAENGLCIEQSKALKLGIDDCYVSPADFKNIRKRIEFLFRFKQDFVKQELKEQEHLEFKLPLGKRLFDILVAGTVLLFISPILILIAICIKLESKGPIVYRSKRVGSGYQVFDFLKFRSMCQDADAKLDKLSHLNHYSQTGSEKKDGPSFVKLKNDPRVTRVGKFIRKTSIDEIPQLFNVLRGEMSIVGNRPLPLYEAEQLTQDGAARRFWAPAGLTGLWQTSGKGKDNMTTEERIELDVEYADKYSLGMDFKILCRTLPAMVQKEE